MQPPFPAYSGPDPYVFVCWAHEDEAEVYPQLLRLRDAGFNLWYDEGIAPGSSWRDEVALALTQCSALLFFATPASSASPVCQQELNFALSRERKVLAVHLAQTELTPGLELALADRQAILRYQLADADYWRKLETSIRRVLPEARPDLRKLIEPPKEPDDGQSIAILPFANRSRDPDNEYLSDGITEQMIEGLDKLDGLRVKSFLAVTAYRGPQLSAAQIGHELGVESIVSGSLQQAGNRVRVSIALTRVRDGASLWSGHFDREMDDIFALQDDIALQVVDVLKVEFSGVPAERLIEVGTKSVAAYQAYLLGRWEGAKGTPRSLKRAVDHFEHAMQLDPTWRDACGWLAHTYYWTDLSSSVGEDPVAFEGLRRAVQRLEGLDPRKSFDGWFNFDQWLLQRGAARSASAIEVIRNRDRYDPGYVRGAFTSLGYRCVNMGLYSAALALHELGNDRPYQRAQPLAGLHRFDAGIDACSAALRDELAPSVAPLGDHCIWSARTGQYRRAADDIELLDAQFGGKHHFPAFNFSYWQGHLDAARQSYEWLATRRRFASAYKGMCAVMLDDMQTALDHFEHAADEKGVYNRILRWMADVYLGDAQRAALVAEPRWNRALTAMGIDDEAQSEFAEQLNALTPTTGITVAPDI